METEVLEELGLTRNEAITYLTLLDLDKAHAGEIADKTKMHRRTVYDCLERLEDRGLVSFVMEGKTRFFLAVNPNKFINILKEKETKIESIMPKLLEMAKKSKRKIEVTVHTSKEGLKNIMEDVIKTKPKVWCSLTSAGKGTTILPYFIPNFHKRRIKSNISLKIIFAKDEEATKRANELKNLESTSIKFIDSKYVIPISIWIFENKIAFMMWDAETGILIENKEIYETFNNYFHILWKIAKP